MVDSDHTDDPQPISEGHVTHPGKSDLRDPKKSVERHDFEKLHK